LTHSTNTREEFISQIERTMLRDRFRLRKLARSLQQARARKHDSSSIESELRLAIDESLALVERRAAMVKPPEFSDTLPINARRDEIAAAIKRSQVVVICGETGSGKSTQLPKICLEAGFGVTGLIGHTQPRRIAARSISTRLASELKSTVGDQVGFKIRFTDKTKQETLIKLMTDGILLAETGRDRFLEQYEVIIIDEAHERSLNIDFLMGYIKRLLPKRPELRLIITSATIDAERFSKHFSVGAEPAPIIEVSGRTFPVDIKYRPLLDDQEGTEIDQLTGIVNAVHELSLIDRGDILVFLPTERDIRETAKRLRAEKLPGDGAHQTEILPLYARLSTKEQNRVFQTSKYRRIVLATNVAESSLTVPGIRYVIDTGTARISRYSPRSKVQRLPIEPVSQASANQRAGRCGRVANGICIRLYSESDYTSRAEYTTPEIQRTNLASVILQAKALRLGHVDTFPFLDPPRPESIRDGYKTLFEIQAVDERRELTRMGQELSRLPIDPRLGRIILAAKEERCLREILVIASALELQDPRERPVDKQQAADLAHEKFIDLRSDFLAFLKLWDFYHDLKIDLSRNQLKRACQQNFLSHNRMREWTEIHRQLQQMLGDKARKQLRTEPNDFEIASPEEESAGDITSPKYAAIHKSLLSGFLSGVSFLSGEHEFTAAGNIKFFLWPGSGIFNHKPKWCLTSELIETARRYGRTNARIDPSWIEPLALHVVKRSYSDPHWHRKRGTVMAYEKVSLFGLPIVMKRRVAYGKIDPVESHDIFIRDGLLHDRQDGNWRFQSAELSGETIPAARHGKRNSLGANQFRFFLHNQNVLAEIAKLAAKTRSNEYLVEESLLQDFYHSRIAASVFDWHSLKRWFKENEHAEETLMMSIGGLLGDIRQAADPHAFPNDLNMGTLQLPVAYKFAPGEEDDGISVVVPQDAIGHLHTGRTGWLIPGLLEDKITALIRSLPKNLRRNFIPAPDTAKRIAAAIEYGVGDFFEQVVGRLNQESEERVRTQDFQMDKLPDHLRLNIRVIDDQGAVKAQGRDLAEVRRAVGATAPEQIVSTDDGRWQRDGIESWDFGELPKQITIARAGIEIPVYPALVDAQESVQLRLFESAALAKQVSIKGISRLYAQQCRKALRSQIAWLPEFDQMALYAASLMTPEQLRGQLRDLICRRAFLDGEKKLPRSEEDFVARLDNSAERIGIATQDAARLLPRLFTAFHEARLSLEETNNRQAHHAVSDLQEQMGVLLSDGFLTHTPWRWLAEFPRYLRGIPHRLERLASGSLEKDIESTYEIANYWRQYTDQKAIHEEDRVYDTELEMYRWMIEEYRVSCFAQSLGTAFSVSPKRLAKQWGKVKR
jgi:ATP-dependent helicase HrpA